MSNECSKTHADTFKQRYNSRPAWFKVIFWLGIAFFAVLTGAAVAVTYFPDQVTAVLGLKSARSSSAVTNAYYIKEGQPACVSVEKLDEYMRAIFVNDLNHLVKLRAAQECLAVPNRTLRFSNNFNVTTANIGGGDNEVIQIVYPKITLWTLRLSTNY